MAGVPQKPLTRVLMILLLMIWGAVAWQVVDAVSRMDASPESVSVPELPEKRPPYVYRADVPDPFTGRKVRADSSLGRTGKKPKSLRWMPPPLALTGILTQKKKATAVLQASDGTTFFLGRGDTLHGVRILRIEPKMVSYSYGGKKAQWVLE
jgi:hypothetical protein